MEIKEIKIELEEVKEIKEERLWIEEFYKCVGNSLFLANQGDDTSFRQSYIIIDNSVEQFLKNYVINIKKKTEYDIKKRKQTGNKNVVEFIDIINESKDQNNQNICDILDRVFQYHEARNNLYHSPQQLSVHKKMFSNYLNDMISFCELIGITNSKNFIGKSYHLIFDNIFRKNMEMRSKSLRKIEDLLNEVFQIMPGKYFVDIMLGSPSGDSQGAMDAIKLISLGSFGMGDGRNTRILELIDNDEEDAFHTFFVSYIGSNIWYCFYRCFWSKWGKGDDYYLSKIRKFIDMHKDKIDHKIEPRSKRNISFDMAFDPMFVGDNEHINSLTQQNINGGNKRLSLYEYEKYDNFYIPL